MARVIDTKALPNYRLWLRFEDGVEGEVDLTDLVGQGVFTQWLNHVEFEKVFISAETHTVTWPGGIDLCPDTLKNDVLSRQPAFRNSGTS